MKTLPGIIWTSVKINVDMDTGEIIKNKEAKLYYIKIKTIKNVKINQQQTKGIVEYHNFYRRNPQQKFNFS